MSPRWRVEEPSVAGGRGRLVEDEGESVVDIILTVPTDKAEAVIEAIAEPVRQALEEPEPEP